MSKFPNNYSIYEATYGNDFPSQMIFLHRFGVMPSYFSFKTNYKSTIVDELIGKGYHKESEWINRSKTYYSEKLFFINNENATILILSSDLNTNYYRVELFYDCGKGKYDVFFNETEMSKFVYKDDSLGNIYLIKNEGGFIDLEKFKLDVPKLDVTLNYGKDFNNTHNIIVKKLNEKKGKGIILFHGDPGTGKTSYIRHLTTLVKDKKVIFLPPSLSETLSEPSLIPFLMENKESILIIEDGERVISDRDLNGSSTAVSNILNLTDGILADCLNIQIIVTFNMKREKIDKALLRKGRLICEHVFKPLSVDESNELLNSLGKTQVVNKPMTLSDIYNIDDELIKVDDEQKIGFKK